MTFNFPVFRKKSPIYSAVTSSFVLAKRLAVQSDCRLNALCNYMTVSRKAGQESAVKRAKTHAKEMTILHQIKEQDLTPRKEANRKALLSLISDVITEKFEPYFQRFSRDKQATVKSILDAAKEYTSFSCCSFNMKDSANGEESKIVVRETFKLHISHWIVADLVDNVDINDPEYDQVFQDITKVISAYLEHKSVPSLKSGYMQKKSEEIDLALTLWKSAYTQLNDVLFSPIRAYCKDGRFEDVVYDLFKRDVRSLVKKLELKTQTVPLSIDRFMEVARETAGCDFYLHLKLLVVCYQNNDLDAFDQLVQSPLVVEATTVTEEIIRYLNDALCYRDFVEDTANAVLISAGSSPVTNLLLFKQGFSKVSDLISEKFDQLSSILEQLEGMVGVNYLNGFIEDEIKAIINFVHHSSRYKDDLELVRILNLESQNHTKEEQAFLHDMLKQKRDVCSTGSTILSPREATFSGPPLSLVTSSQEPHSDSSDY